MTPGDDDLRGLRDLLTVPVGAAVAELLGVRDPGAFEAEAARLLPDLGRLPTPELAGELVGVIGGVEGGPRVLAALAVSASSTIASAAAAVLAGLDDPPRPLGRLTVVEGWELDVDEPVSAIYLLCTREGAPGAQVLGFTIEHELTGGAVKDGLVSGLDEGDAVVRALAAGPDGIVPTALAAAEALARVITAFEVSCQAGLAPLPDGFLAAAILLRASGYPDGPALLRLLETGRPIANVVDEGSEERLAAEVEELSVALGAWIAGQPLPDARAAWARLVLVEMCRFMATVLDDTARGWGEAAVMTFLLDWVPGEIGLEPEAIEPFVTALADVLTFLGSEGRIHRVTATRAAAVARDMQDAFAEAVEQAELTPAGVLIRAMRAEGVDPTDPDAADAWLERFDALPIAEKAEILGSAADRRTPPAAGAGGDGARRKAARRSQKQARRRNRRP